MHLAASVELILTSTLQKYHEVVPELTALRTAASASIAESRVSDNIAISLPLLPPPTLTVTKAVQAPVLVHSNSLASTSTSQSPPDPNLESDVDMEQSPVWVSPSFRVYLTFYNHPLNRRKNQQVISRSHPHLQCKVWTP